MQESPKCGRCLSDYALLALRLAAGIIFLVHGYVKLFGVPGMAMVVKMVTGMGFPLPTIFAYALALTEFFGGIALIIGIRTKLASGLLMFVMVVAGTLAKNWKLPQADPDLALLAITFAIYLSGAGSYTIQRWIGKR